MWNIRQCGSIPGLANNTVPTQKLRFCMFHKREYRESNSPSLAKHYVLIKGSVARFYFIKKKLLSDYKENLLMGNKQAFLVVSLLIDGEFHTQNYNCV